mmetsp:Transcript_8319/g.10398  ORF Transcript_8319/g.10398 Transcript_8319/m.10398 type:complete len:88 (-) Transcript_8319:905-1168(-)
MRRVENKPRIAYLPALPSAKFLLPLPSTLPVIAAVAAGCAAIILEEKIPSNPKPDMEDALTPARIIVGATLSATFAATSVIPSMAAS